MPRDVPVGNRRLLVCFDRDYVLRDLYYPHVGQENHVGGGRCRMGCWTEDGFAWIGPEWRPDLAYQEGTMVTRVTLEHPDLAVRLVCRDAVDFHEDVYLREIAVENRADREREIRLLFVQDLNISGNNVGDSAYLDPASGGLIHYKGDRYFLANGLAGRSGPVQYAVGVKELSGREGTFRDAEDGVLSGNAAAQGSVDSVLALHLRLAAGGRGTAYYWLVAGPDRDSVQRTDARVRRRGPDSLLRRTADYWSAWARKETPPMEGLPETVRKLYLRSLLVVATQVDADGGILAANDTDVMQFNRDTYSYVWPRDGALVAHALDLAGYPVPARAFYAWAARRLTRDGYFLHKYNPDGTPASSWHPWVRDGEPRLPIQEDETGLVLWALWHHFVLYREIEFIKPLYRPVIKAAADFMRTFRDPATGLPAPSYDLWEERWGIFSFTTAAVFAGLTAAARFCSVFGETDRAETYGRAASEIREAAARHLFRADEKRFCRGLIPDRAGTPVPDLTPDASLWGLFALGLFPAHDPRVASTMDHLRKALWVETDVGGMARYAGDAYHRVREDLPGNPWFVCTLWYADYLIERARSPADLAPARAILEWVADHALPSGVLAEQLDPRTGRALSVSPLTWSHAALVATVQRLVRRNRGMTTCPACGSPGRGFSLDTEERG